VNQQLARTRRSGHRPCYARPTRSRARAAAGGARALYEETADIVVDTDGRKVKSVVEDVLRRLDAARSA